MGKLWAALIVSLTLAGCVAGSKKELASLVKTYFEGSFNCGRGWPERTFEQCWSRYSDIIKEE